MFPYIAGARVKRRRRCIAVDASIRCQLIGLCDSMLSLVVGIVCGRVM